MASNIDVSVPTPVRATTKSVRDNFIAAKDEIEALQDNESAIGADILDEKNRNDAQDLRLDQLEDDVSNIEVTITTSMVETEVGDGTREAEPSLTNQKEVNNYLWETVSNLEPYDDEQVQKELEELQNQIDALAELHKPEPERLPLFSEDEPTEYPSDPVSDLEEGDQWYKVEDPDFDYENPDPFGLELYLWDSQSSLWVLWEAELDFNGVIISPSPPEEFGDGMLWFDNTADTMQLFVYHEASDAWLPVAPPSTLEGRVATNEATQEAIIAQIQESLVDQAKIVARVEEGLDDQAKIAAKVEELSITKGAVSRYVVKGTEPSVASRNGELYVNAIAAAEVTFMSLAPFDSNGQVTKACNPDDIIEFVEVVEATREIGDITRYKVVSGDYNNMTVEYLSGNNDFDVGEVEEIYIYPQNQDLASIEYVDAQNSKKLSLIGGMGNKMEGDLYLGGNKVAGVATPSLDTDATNKEYVDNNFMNLNGPQEADGNKTFTSYVYLSNSSNNANGVLRRDTIESLIEANILYFSYNSPNTS